MSPQTRDQKLHTWLQSLVSHTRSATRIVLLPLWCLEHLPASQLWVLLSASATPLRYPMVGRAAPATWLHKLVHLHMRCTVNYFSGTGSQHQVLLERPDNRATETLLVSKKSLIPSEILKSFQDTHALNVLFFKFPFFFFLMAVKFQLNNSPGTLLTGVRFCDFAS